MSAIETDVLVLGGGPAGAWAALSAAAAGARVVLVDKGRCGASGPTASGVSTLWNIPPGPARDEAVRQAVEQGGDLGDPDWMHRMLEETHRRVDQLTRWGHRFPAELCGTRVRLGGASYLRRLRRRLREAGVLVLDHHPALQLLVDRDGVVGGATGLQHRYRGWTVHAGAVVVATGGCAFRSGGAGTEGNTGDGLLLAAEAGAQLSGMEFSSAYGLAPVSGAPAHAMRFEKLYDETGAVLSDHPAAFAAIGQGRRVYAALDDLPAHTRNWLSQQGVDATAARVLLRPVLGGTVGGTGGLLLTAPECATTVPGLYAAGDAATREPITGAASGFGGQGGSWAIASGVWAGAGAARFAQERGTPGPVRPVPGAGLSTRARIDPRAVIGLVQEHTLPLRRSYWRSAGSLRDSIAELDAMWPGAEFDLGGAGADRLSARQAAALLAVARWTKYSALARTESRGMHQRTDHPEAGADWRVRLTSGGLDRIWVRTDVARPAAPVAVVPAAEVPVPLGRRPDGWAGGADVELDPGVRRTSGQKSVLAVARTAGTEPAGVPSGAVAS
ncbi:FAD-dependent oxidoreductase [Nocardia sp. XZ_19_385]|uniref:FAD-dependent oxidoreductase n=1 Tax=Nocardia sp. XZ_19_385 TaxID=2769488 RepID=UPI00188F6452|nr:FAD-binding protein [Nocardia sp. XZ_19_385]